MEEQVHPSVLNQRKDYGICSDINDQEANLEQVKMANGKSQDKSVVKKILIVGMILILVIGYRMHQGAYYDQVSEQSQQQRKLFAFGSDELGEALDQQVEDECESAQAGIADYIETLEKQYNYTINYQQPTFTFAAYPDQSADSVITIPLCQIDSYTVVSSDNTDEPHPDFELISQDSEFIAFGLKNQSQFSQINTYNDIKIKFSSPGADVLSDLIEFKIECGSETIEAYHQNIPTSMTYNLDGNQPVLKIQRFNLTSAQCNITQYNLLQYNLTTDKFELIAQNNDSEFVTFGLVDTALYKTPNIYDHLSIQSIYYENSTQKNTSSQMITFETVCSTLLYTDYIQSLDLEYKYTINNEQPTFWIATYQTTSSDECGISEYEIVNADNETNLDYNVSRSLYSVVFGLTNEELYNYVDNYQGIYIRFGTDEGDIISQQIQFQTICGPQTYATYLEQIPEQIEYPLDGNQPFFTFDGLPNIEGQCQISKYELLLASQTGMVIHPDFEIVVNEDSNDTDSSQIMFRLLVEEADYFKIVEKDDIYVQITYGEDQQLTTSQSIKFKTTCTQDAFQEYLDLINQDYRDFEYIINGDQPLIEFPRYSYIEGECQVTNYQLVDQNNQLLTNFQQIDQQSNSIAFGIVDESIYDDLFVIENIILKMTFDDGFMYSDQISMQTVCDSEFYYDYMEQIQLIIDYPIDGNQPLLQFDPFPSVEAFSYIINGQQPSMEFPSFHSGSGQCGIQNYELIYNVRRENFGNGTNGNIQNYTSQNYDEQQQESEYDDYYYYSDEYYYCSVDSECLEEQNENIITNQNQQQINDNDISESSESQISQNNSSNYQYDSELNIFNQIVDPEQNNIVFGLADEDRFNDLFKVDNMILQMTFEGGQMSSDPISFQTICGEETFEPYIAQINSSLSSNIEFEINGEQPAFEFPRFQNEDNQCQISSYELINQDNQTYSDFVLVESGSDMVSFGLNDQNAYNTVSRYPNISIKLTTDGGNITTQLISFMVTCGQMSYDNYFSQLNSTSEFVLNGERPLLSFNAIDNIEPQCNITSYLLVDQQNQTSEDFEIVSNDSATIVFGLADVQQFTKVNEYKSIFLKLITDTGKEIISQQSLNFSTICGNATYSVPSISDLQVYVFEVGSQPYLQIPQFNSVSEDCKYINYQIYDREGLHNSFNQTYSSDSENNTLTFFLNEPFYNNQTYSYYVAATTETNSTLSTESNLSTLGTVCGPQSAQIVGTQIINTTVYTIDQELPILSFEPFETNSSICIIQDYQLFQSKDDNFTHTAFSNYSMSEDNQTISFNLTGNQITNLTYYLKVTALGGEVYWSEDKVFTTECGANSDIIKPNQHLNTSSFNLDGNSIVEISQFETEFGICPIQSYQLLEKDANGTYTVHPQFENNATGTLGNESVQFTFNKTNITNNIIEYYIQVIAEGNITYISEVQQVNSEIYCLDIATLIETIGEQNETTQWVNINDPQFFQLTIDYVSRDTTYCSITSILIQQNNTSIPELELVQMNETKYVQPINKDQVNIYEFQLKIMIGSESILGDNYTLRVGCIPTNVSFQWAAPLLNSIDLAINSDPINIYTIQPLINEPANINCPVLKYEIVPSGVGNYKNCQGPIINAQLTNQGDSQLPIMLSKEDDCEGMIPCNQLTLISRNIIEEFKFKINVTIDNEMNGNYSFVETEEITLTVSCSSDDPQFTPSISEEIQLGKESEFTFSSFTCSPEDCCQFTYQTRANMVQSTNPDQLIEYATQPSLIDSNKYQVQVFPQYQQSTDSNTFVVEAFNQLDCTSIFSPSISFDEYEQEGDQETTSNALGETEGKMEGSSLLSQDLFDTYQMVGSCKYISNMQFNVIYCLNGNMVMQDAFNMNELMHYQLPQEMLTQIQALSPPVFKMFTAINNGNYFTILAADGVYNMTQTSSETEDTSISIEQMFDLQSLKEQIVTIYGQDLDSNSILDIQILGQGDQQWGILLFENDDQEQEDIVRTQYLIFFSYDPTVNEVSLITDITSQNNQQQSLLSIVINKNYEAIMTSEINDSARIQFMVDSTIQYMIISPQLDESIISQVSVLSSIFDDSQIKQSLNNQQAEVESSPSIRNFAVFKNMLALSYQNIDYIVIYDLVNSGTYQLSTNTSQERAGSKVLYIGQLQDSNDQTTDQLNSFKVVYTHFEDYQYVYNEVHFYWNYTSGSWSIFHNNNLFTSSEIGINSQVYFTTRGSNILFIDSNVDVATGERSLDLKSMKMFVQARYDEYFVPQTENNQRRLLQNSQISLEGNKISEFLPASSKKCEAEQGTYNQFVNKFQSQECGSCSEIYQSALERKELGLDYEYDLYIALQLCPQLQIEEEEEQQKKATEEIDEDMLKTAVIIICSIIALFILIIALYCYCKEKRKKQQSQKNETSEKEEFVQFPDSPAKDSSLSLQKLSPRTPISNSRDSLRPLHDEKESQSGRIRPFSLQEDPTGSQIKSPTPDQQQQSEMFSSKKGSRKTDVPKIGKKVPRSSKFKNQQNSNKNFRAEKSSYYIDGKKKQFGHQTDYYDHFAMIRDDDIQLEEKDEDIPVTTYRQREKDEEDEAQVCRQQSLRSRNKDIFSQTQHNISKDIMLYRTNNQNNRLRQFRPLYQVDIMGSRTPQQAKKALSRVRVQTPSPPKRYKTFQSPDHVVDNLERAFQSPNRVRTNTYQNRVAAPGQGERPRTGLQSSLRANLFRGTAHPQNYQQVSPRNSRSFVAHYQQQQLI